MASQRGLAFHSPHPSLRHWDVDTYTPKPFLTPGPQLVLCQEIPSLLTLEDAPAGTLQFPVLLFDAILLPNISKALLPLS